MADAWVLLAYRMPREPSTPRINVWRKLRRLGVLQVVDGLVTLPASAANREQLGWIADEIIDAHGEAWTWTATPDSNRQHKELVARLTAMTAEEYQAIIDEAAALEISATRRNVDRLRRELKRIESHDHVRPKERDAARVAVDELAVAVEEAGSIR